MLRLAFVAVIVVAATNPARAEPSEPTDAAPIHASYAPWVLASDGLALGLLSGAYLANESRAEPTLATSATWTFRLGAPLVHLAHGHPVRALGSLAMRIVLPLVGGYLQQQLEGHDGLGIGLGVVAATILDAALANRDDRPIARGFVPTAMASGHHVGIGVAGWF